MDRQGNKGLSSTNLTGLVLITGALLTFGLSSILVPWSTLTIEMAPVFLLCYIPVLAGLIAGVTCLYSKD